MKRKIVILAVLAVFILSSTASAVAAADNVETKLALEKVGYESATVTVSKLNVREGPSTSYPSICKLEKGQSVTVMGKLGNWYAVYSPDKGVVGAVDGRYIKFGNDSIAVNSNDIAANDAFAGKTPSSRTGVTLSEDEQKLFELVNKARSDKGLDPLAIDETLMKTARIKAKDMVENNYFSHQSPTYGSPFDMMRQFKSAFKSAGENIAGNKTVDGAFKAWMSSDSHKKNILNPGFDITGIGIEESKTYGKIIVQQFIGK